MADGKNIPEFPRLRQGDRDPRRQLGMIRESLRELSGARGPLAGSLRQIFEGLKVKTETEISWGGGR